MRNFIYRLLERLLVIGMVIPLFLAAVYSEQSTIVVRLAFSDSATVNDTAIYLRDIATVAAENDSMISRLAAVPVGEAAPAGYSRFVNTNELLSYRLRQAFGGVTFVIAEQKRVTVRTGCVEKKAGDYKSIICDYIRLTSNWKEGWIKNIEIENAAVQWKCYDAPLEVAAEGLTNAFPKGHIQLQLLSRQFGKTFRVPLTCRVEIVAPVVVARTTIPNRKVIGPDDIEIRTADITDFGPMPWFSAQEAIGKVALRTIAGGTILQNRWCADQPVVIKGDAVSIVVTKGDVRISVAAIARENGYRGQKIWVENTSSHKLVRVIVKDRNTAVLL